MLHFSFFDAKSELHQESFYFKIQLQDRKNWNMKENLWKNLQMATNFLTF